MFAHLTLVNAARYESSRSGPHADIEDSSLAVYGRPIGGLMLHSGLSVANLATELSVSLRVIQLPETVVSNG